MSDDEIQVEIERRWGHVQEAGKDFHPIWEIAQFVSADMKANPGGSFKQSLYKYLYSDTPAIAPRVDLDLP